MTTAKYRDSAHDPRTQPGAKEKASSMKAKSKTFDKPKQQVSEKGAGKAVRKNTVEGLGSGMLENARKAITGRSGRIDKAIKDSGG